ncbi:MAG: FecR family protein [Mangrovibacterium sp.]
MTLNGGSKLSYATNRFNKRQRDIWLEGEAFFRGCQKPPKTSFVVHTTGNMQTIVRGTSFNVKAYPQLDENLVSVSTGKVEIHSGAKLLDTLTANEQLAYHISTEAYSKTRSNPEDAIAWISKRLVLKNAGAKELAIRLKQLYGMELSVEGDILRDKKFGASFTAGATFEEVIQGICRLYDLNYKIIAANQVVIYE